MSFIESFKSIVADEKVQMFAAGVVTGAVVTGAIAYFCNNKNDVVAAAADTTAKAAEAAENTAGDVKDKAEDVKEQAENNKPDNNNPKDESVE